MLNITQKLPDPAQQTSALSANPSGNTASTQEDKAARRNLNELKTLLTKQGVDAILRAPDSQDSEEKLARLGVLLTQGNIRSMLRGPNAEANAKTLEDLGDQLNKAKIDTAVGTTKSSAQKTLISQLTLSILQNLLKSFEEDSDGIDGLVNLYILSQKKLSGLSKNFSTADSAAKSLTNFGGALNRSNLDAVRLAPSGPSNRGSPKADNLNTGDRSNSNTKIHY